ncbi:MAG: hypothetical protein DRI44_06625 [Chlamydiae bacterium]|nr:MAG: hypothetical protein DRI44_06625 [Chlamydiota bacterium]
MRKQFIRRITFGANVAFSIVLVFALVVMANWIAKKYPKSYDFVQTSDLYKISDKTKNILKSLNQDVEFYVFSNPQDSELYSKIQRLLKAYNSASSKVKFTMVDPVRDIDKVRILARDLNVEEPDTVVVKIGENKKVLTEMDMADFKFRHNDYTGGQIKEMKQFKAEQAFTSAILELINPKKIYAKFTVKHGERNIFGYKDNGMSEAKRYLLRDNITAEPIELISLTEITNCDVLVVAGPTRKFLPHEVNLIRHYINNGGRAMIMLDPEVQSGLESLLKEYNIKIGNDIVVDPERQMPYASPMQLIIGLYADHPITKNLKTFTIFPIARSVSIINEDNKVYRARALAVTSGRGWGETDTDSEKFKFDLKTDNEGPISVAVIVENNKTGMRLAVFGDADFASNRDFGKGANKDFFLNTINWLVKREVLISIGPKTIAEMKRLNFNASQLKIVTIVVIVAVPLSSVIAGFFVYLRRKQ